MEKNDDRPTMKLHARFINGKSCCVPACEKSNALGELLSIVRTPGRVILPNELPLIGRMGFQIMFSGDKKELKRQLQREEIIEK